MSRDDVADYVYYVILVYTLCIIGWVVTSMVFSLGARVPYNRFSNAVLDFLRDVAEPYLRIFRRFVPRLGVFDLSPIVAILVLQIVGGLIVGIVRGS